MSKHFKFSLDKGKFGSRNMLRGTEIDSTNLAELHKAYEESDFHYQFVGDEHARGPSRIMSCTSSTELLWIEKQIKDNKTKVTVYPNHTVKRIVYHRDP